MKPRYWWPVLLFWSSVAWAQSPDLELGARLFAQAQTQTGHQAQATLAQAELAFLSLAQTTDRPQAWADLGMIEEQLGKPVLALWAYRKALRKDPGLAAARQGELRLCESLGLIPPPRSPWAPVLALPPWVWGLGLWAGLAGLGLFWSHRRGWALWGLVLALGCGGFLSAPLWSPGAGQTWQVMEPIGLREGPGLEYPEVAPVKPGELLEPQETRGPWVRVPVAGKDLWAPNSALARL